MRHFFFILFFWTSFYFCLPSVAIAQEDRPNRDRPLFERFRQARKKLNEQRHQLEMERQELERWCMPWCVLGILSNPEDNTGL